MMALDRKRRMTGSVDESARRRAASGGIYRHGHPYGLDSHPNQASRSGSHLQPWMNPTSEDRSRDVSSPQITPNQPYPRRTSSASHRDAGIREYVRPPWQPDSDVIKCPICGTQFTFWYRKHHCRKCGRVVCASCSPHRITIPRQFIVQPPNSNTTSATSPTDSSRIEIIDLTEDDSGSHSRTMNDPNQPPEEPPNPALGGGEEVRLCNPCVPDPNPNPPQSYRFPSSYLLPGSDASAFGPTPTPPNYRAPGFLERPTTRNPNAWNSGQTGPYAGIPPYVRNSEDRRRRGQGMIVCQYHCSSLDSRTNESQFPSTVEDAEDDTQDVARGARPGGPRYDFSRILQPGQDRLPGAQGSSAPPYYPSAFNGPVSNLP